MMNLFFFPLFVVFFITVINHSGFELKLDERDEKNNRNTSEVLFFLLLLFWFNQEFDPFRILYTSAELFLVLL